MDKDIVNGNKQNKENEGENVEKKVEN